MPIRAAVLALAVAVLAAASGPSAAVATAAPACDRVAALDGDDGAPGSPQAPVRTIRRLFAVTAPGQTACLTAGETFYEITNINPSGRADAPIVLTSTPGAHATITGQIRFIGSHIHITGVDFGGTAALGASAPKTYHLGVDGDDVHVDDADITSPRGICIDVGEIDAYGGVEGVRPDDFELTSSRVHGCGLRNLADGQLTAADSGVHGIYLKHTRNARIVDDAVYDNADRGIQLWPDADGTLIAHDVLDGNGSNLNLGSYAPNGYFSENTEARDNVISNSVLRSCDGCNVPPGDTAQVLGNFPAGLGTFGNVVEHNCVFEQDPSRNFDGSGFVEGDNVFAPPVFADRDGGDFAQRADSPCAGFGLEGDGAMTPSPQPGGGPGAGADAGAAGDDPAGHGVTDGPSDDTGDGPARGGDASTAPGSGRDVAGVVRVVPSARRHLRLTLTRPLGHLRRARIAVAVPAAGRVTVSAGASHPARAFVSRAATVVLTMVLADRPFVTVRATFVPRRRGGRRQYASLGLRQVPYPIARSAVRRLSIVARSASASLRAAL